MGPVTQTHFGEWASASRTFVAITDLMAVVQREVDMFFVLIFESMHACSNSYFMPAEVDCSYVNAVRASPPDVVMARVVALCATAASRRPSRPACATVKAPFTACSV